MPTVSCILVIYFIATVYCVLLHVLLSSIFYAIKIIIKYSGIK